MPREQYDKWFSDEQQNVTHERKQKLLFGNTSQQQQQQKRTPILQQKTNNNGRKTPQYVERQIDSYSSLLSPQNAQIIIESNNVMS